MRQDLLTNKHTHVYPEQKAFRNRITTMIYCSAGGLTLYLIIIFERSWPSGPYA